jgi:hypothetical protein
MYLVRFDGTNETWATKITDSTAAHPPYLNGPTDTNSVVFVWWYAHNGRIAFDGSNYGAFFGAAISVSQTCGQGSPIATGVNIHQGDRLSVVSMSGAIQSTGFGWGCSHSGYERVIWDPAAKIFVPVCKNDLPDGNESGRLALAPNFTNNAIQPLDLYYSDFGNVLPAGGGGYWAVTSNIRSGQTPNSDGLADVHLLHFGITGGKVATANMPDKDIMLASDMALNDRAPHLVAFGANRVLAAWETSTMTGDLKPGDPNRKLYIQALDATTGAAEGSPFNVVGLTANRFQDFRPYPDGSVAYPAPGSGPTKVKILRVTPCN